MTDSHQLLGEYQCHKVVRAGRILKIIVSGEGELHVETVPGEFVVVPITHGLFARYRPKVGEDYYVVYDNGYKSVSPKAAFEAGYARK